MNKNTKIGKFYYTNCVNSITQLNCVILFTDNLCNKFCWFEHLTLFTKPIDIIYTIEFIQFVLAFFSWFSTIFNFYMAQNSLWNMIFLKIWLHLVLWHMRSSLWPAGTSSLIRDQTRDPLLWEHRILTPGLPGKSPIYDF